MNSGGQLKPAVYIKAINLVRDKSTLQTLSMYLAGHELSLYHKSCLFLTERDDNRDTILLTSLMLGSISGWHHMVEIDIGKLAKSRPATVASMFCGVHHYFFVRSRRVRQMCYLCYNYAVICFPFLVVFSCIRLRLPG